MITISATGTTTGTRYRVQLPHFISFTPSNPRQQVTRIALAGNAVQQYSAKNTSAGSFAYSGTVETEKAATINTIQFATGECILGYELGAWLCTIDAVLTPSQYRGKTNLAIMFKVIRKLAV